MSQVPKLKKIIDSMDNKGLARSGITIGKRAQEYGRPEKIKEARINFSFSVDSNRLADISFSANSNPDKNSYIKSRVGIWWWSDPESDKKRSTYVQSIEEKINKAIERELVQYDNSGKNNPLIIPGNSSSVLSDIGQYNRIVYENVKPFMSRKIRCILGSFITDQIFNDYPDVNEIIRDVKDIKFKFENESTIITGESIISQLESLSVIRRVSNKFIPFYAYEIFGEKIEQIFEDNTFDSHLDVVKHMIMKMPGISHKTLFKQLPSDARKDVITTALEGMADKKLIYTIKTQNTLFEEFTKDGSSLIYIPTWFLHFIMDRKPELVQTEAFLLSLISLSWFWESMKNPLDNFDNEMDNLTQFLNQICKGSINWRDIVSLGIPTANFALTMRKTGILLDQDKNLDEAYCIQQSVPVIEALNAALKQSYDTEIWFGGLRRRHTDIEPVIQEINNAYLEINKHMLDKWRPNRLDESLPEFK